MRRSIVLAIVLALAPTPASALDIHVNTRIDLADPHPGDGVCGVRWPGGDLCSLRAAIQEANAAGEPVIITLESGTYPLRIPGAGEDLGATGDLDIFGDVTIVGRGVPASFCTDDVAGAGACLGLAAAGELGTVIRAANQDRVFHIHPSGNARISGVAIADGRPPVGFSIEAGGGGIFNSGSIELTNVALAANTAHAGGGLLNGRNALARLSKVTVRRNHAHRVPHGGCGGGLFNGGYMSLADSIISSNDVSGAGGGICNRSMLFNAPPFPGSESIGATLEMGNVSISRNSSDGDGGGIATYSSLFAFFIEIVENSAVSQGGGLFIGGTDVSGRPVDLFQASIRGNIASGGLDPRTHRSVGDGEGGGIATHGLLRLRSVNVHDNDARVSGGGLWMGFSADVRIAQSTFAGNTARYNGGGVQAEGSFLEMVNVTVQGNSARTGGGVNLAASPSRLRSVTFAGNETTGRDGASLRASASLVLRNTIFSDPRGRGGDNCLFVGAAVTREGHNLESGNSCGFPAADSFVDLQLADLGSEPNFPPIMPLGAGSPAVDAVELGACDSDWEFFLLVDERGVPRPQGAACDAGAYERRSFIPSWLFPEIIDLGPAASAVVATSLKLRLAVAKQQDASAAADAIVSAASDLQHWIELALSAPDEQNGRALLMKEAGQALTLLRQTMDAASHCCQGLATRFSFTTLATAVNGFDAKYMRVTQPPKPIEKVSARSDEPGRTPTPTAARRGSPAYRVW